MTGIAVGSYDYTNRQDVLCIITNGVNLRCISEDRPPNLLGQPNNAVSFITLILYKIISETIHRKIWFVSNGWHSAWFECKERFGCLRIIGEYLRSCRKK